MSSEMRCGIRKTTGFDISTNGLAAIKHHLFDRSRTLKRMLGL